MSAEKMVTLGIDVDAGPGAKSVDALDRSLQGVEKSGITAAVAIAKVTSEATKQTAALQAQQSAQSGVSAADAARTKELEAQRAASARAAEESAKAAAASSAAATKATSDAASQSVALREQQQRLMALAEAERAEAMAAAKRSEVESVAANKALSDSADARKAEEARAKATEFAGRMRAQVASWDKDAANRLKVAAQEVREAQEKQLATTERLNAAEEKRIRTMGLTQIEGHKMNDAGVTGEGILVKTARGASDADKAVGKFRGSLTSLAAGFLGTAGPASTLVSNLAQMVVGGAITVGVLAAGAAIAGVYDLMTKKSREQAKEQRDQTKALEDFLKVKAQGAAGERGVQTDAALRELNETEKKLANVRAQIAAIGQPSLGAPVPGLDLVNLSRVKDLESEQKRLNDIVAGGTKERLRLIAEDNANTKRSQDQGLAQLITSNIATAAERKRAVETLRADKEELAKLNRAALASPEKAKATIGQRNDLAAGIKTMTEALDPAKLKAAEDRLAGVRDQVQRLKEEAAAFGKEASIDTRIATITDALDRMKKQFPSLSTEINKYKGEAVAAGEAMKAAELDKVTASIHEQYLAERSLFDATINGVGSTKELSAARATEMEIAQRRTALGRDLTDAQKLEIKQTNELRAAITAANATKSIQEQANATLEEIDAIKSGASVRVTYAADLLYQKQLIAANSIENVEQRKTQLDAVEALHKAGVELALLKDSTANATREQEKFEKQIAKINQTLRQDLLSGINDLSRNGLSSFKSFFEGVGSLATKMVGQVGSAVVQMEESLKRAKAPNSGSTVADIAKITAEIEKLNRVQKAAGYASIVSSGFDGGYQVGSQTTSKGLGAAGGALRGAATGASLASVVPGIGTAVGAVVGAIAGAIGGMLGSAAKGKQAAAQMAQNQSQIQASLDGLRASFSNDSLGQAIAQAQSQFDQLRKGTEVAYSGKKNEAERNRILAELNGLEEIRIANLKKEFEIAQIGAQEDLAIRKLRAEGHDAEADAMAFAKSQQDEFRDSVKSGATEATLAALAITQQAEATKFAADEAKKAAAETERQRRSVFSTVNAANAFTNPRGSNDAAFWEQQRERYEDATTDVEKLAVKAYNAAEALDHFAQLALKDLTDSATYISRILTGSGNVRGGEDAARLAGQVNERDQAVRSNTSPGNLLLLDRAQFVENSAIQRDRAIADGTKTLTDAANTKLKAIDKIIDDTRAAADKRVNELNVAIADERELNAAYNKMKDGEIKAIQEATKLRLADIDVQLDNARAYQQSAEAQVQAIRQEVDARTKAAESLAQFADSLKLSDLSALSPVDKLAEARRQFDANAAKAQGGDASAVAATVSAAQELLKQRQNVSASGVDSAAEYARVQGIIDALRNKFGASAVAGQGALSSAESAAAAATAQISELEKQRASIEAASAKEIDAINLARDDANAASATQIDLWEKEQKSVSENAATIIAQQELLRTGVTDGLAAAIDTLTSNEEAAHQERLKASDWREQLYKQQEAATNWLQKIAEHFTGVSSGSAVFTGGGPVPVIAQATGPTASETALLQQVQTLTAVVAKLEAKLTTIENNTAATANAVTTSGGNIVSKLGSVDDSVGDVETALRQSRDTSPRYS